MYVLVWARAELIFLTVLASATCVVVVRRARRDRRNKDSEQHNTGVLLQH